MEELWIGDVAVAWDPEHKTVHLRSYDSDDFMSLKDFLQRLGVRLEDCREALSNNEEADHAAKHSACDCATIGGRRKCCCRTLL